MVSWSGPVFDEPRWTAGRTGRRVCAYICKSVTPRAIFHLQLGHLYYDARGRRSGGGESLRVNVPSGLHAAWFPGMALPMAIQLQIVVDGCLWGPRFSSTVTASLLITKGLVEHATPLLGCRLTGFRRGPGPFDVDLLASGDTEGEIVPAAWQMVSATLQSSMSA